MASHAQLLRRVDGQCCMLLCRYPMSWNQCTCQHGRVNLYVPGWCYCTACRCAARNDELQSGPTQVVQLLASQLYPLRVGQPCQLHCMGLSKHAAQLGSGILMLRVRPFISCMSHNPVVRAVPGKH